MKKKIFLVALGLFLALGVVACGTDDNGDEIYEPETEEVGEDEEEEAPEDVEEEETTEADGPGHATSAGGITDGDTLATVLGADSQARAWVAGLGADIEMEGPLYIEGEVERHSAGEWSGVYARKLGLYRREEINGLTQVPVGNWTLTVNEGIIVNSPQSFFISDGPFIADVFANVYVNVPYFRLSGVRINGDVIFASQEYMDTAVWQMWDPEAAEIRDGVEEDYETEFILYQSNSGFATYAPLSSSDATANVSNTDPANLVTGEIRVAE